MSGFVIDVTGDGWLRWRGGRVRAALGRCGVTADKREGDGATPIGVFAIRSLWRRADRVALPTTALEVFTIAPESGWSDDPADPRYNTPVTLPHPFRHEILWREDRLYDLIAPLGYNDAPPVAGLGSAIFLHVASPDYRPTEGCVAIGEEDFLALLPDLSRDCRIRIAA
jgi:L,D-peptidoglycan transpeptidase YkuD (ErfK/YbiS/YcfS/YnhG family)